VRGDLCTTRKFGKRANIGAGRDEINVLVTDPGTGGYGIQRKKNTHHYSKKRLCRQKEKYQVYKLKGRMWDKPTKESGAKKFAVASKKGRGAYKGTPKRGVLWDERGVIKNPHR